MLPIEQERFTGSLADEPVYTTSNSWMEVNYTQLVANARRVLPLVKPGAIPLAMVKVPLIYGALTVLIYGCTQCAGSVNMLQHLNLSLHACQAALTHTLHCKILNGIRHVDWLLRGVQHPPAWYTSSAVQHGYSATRGLRHKSLDPEYQCQHAPIRRCCMAAGQCVRPWISNRGQGLHGGRLP